MESRFIKKLKEIVAKYPYPKIHKILAHLVLAMLKVRHHVNYTLESIQISSFATTQMTQIVQKLGGKNHYKLEKEFLGVINGIILFPDLTEEGATAIAKYCKTLIPEDEDGLEVFLRKRFNATAIQDCPLFFVDKFAILAAAFETVGSFYDENFMFYSEKEVSYKELTQAAIEFYEKKGFSVYSQDYAFYVCMKKEDMLLNVIFSISPDIREVRATVTII